MESIPGQFPISLRAWPSKDDRTVALPSLISRINNQRGSFRGVTEEALEEELKKSEEEVNISNANDKIDEDDEEDEESDRLKEVSTAREEILGQLE
jgi:mediator of RNA polymerase II transcription subunit 17, fungi type